MAPERGGPPPRQKLASIKEGIKEGIKFQEEIDHRRDSMVHTGRHMRIFHF
jgi:hypothetical protein